MYYVGIDLHKQDLVVAVEDEQGPVGKPRRLLCESESAIIELFDKLRPFAAVIEASASYRWLYELLNRTVCLSHRRDIPACQPEGYDCRLNFGGF